MSDIDAVITNLEMQIESRYVPYGHFISLRFIISPFIKGGVKGKISPQ